MLDPRLRILAFSNLTILISKPALRLLMQRQHRRRPHRWLETSQTYRKNIEPSPLNICAGHIDVAKNER